MTDQDMSQFYSTNQNIEKKAMITEADDDDDNIFFQTTSRFNNND